MACLVNQLHCVVRYYLFLGSLKFNFFVPLHTSKFKSKVEVKVVGSAEARVGLRQVED